MHVKLVAFFQSEPLAVFFNFFLSVFSCRVSNGREDKLTLLDEIFIVVIGVGTWTGN